MLAKRSATPTGQSHRLQPSPNKYTAKSSEILSHREMAPCELVTEGRCANFRKKELLLSYQKVEEYLLAEGEDKITAGKEKPDTFETGKIFSPRSSTTGADGQGSRKVSTLTHSWVQTRCCSEYAFLHQGLHRQSRLG